MSFKSNKKVKLEIFYCGKTLTSFSKKSIQKRRRRRRRRERRHKLIEKSGKNKEEIFFQIYLPNVSGVKKIVTSPTTLI